MVKHLLFLSVCLLFISCEQNERKGVSLPAIGAVNEQQQRELDLEKLAQIIEENPIAAEAYYKRASLLESSNLEQAIADINKAIALEPAKPVYYFLRSRVLKGQNKEGEAIKQAETAAADGLDSPLFYTHLASLYLAVDSIKLAQEYIDEALSTVPDLVEGLLVKAAIALKMDDAGKALNTLSDAHRLASKKPDVFDLMAKSYISQEKLDSAYRNNERGLKLNHGNHVGLFYNKGKIFEKLGRSDSAFFYYNKVIDLSPDLAQPHIDMAEMDLRKGYFNRALSSFEKAINKTPDQKSIYLRAGYCLERLFKYKKAQELYLKAKAKFPSDEKIGEAYVRMTNRVERQYRSTNI